MRVWCLQLPSLILRGVSLIIFWHALISDWTWARHMEGDYAYIFGRNSQFLMANRTSRYGYTFEDVSNRFKWPSKAFVIILLVSFLWYIISERLWSQIWSIPLLNGFLIIGGAILSLNSVEEYKFVYSDLIKDTVNEDFRRIFQYCHQYYNILDGSGYTIILEESQERLRIKYCACQEFFWKSLSSILAVLSGILLVFSSLLILMKNYNVQLGWRRERDVLEGPRNNPVDFIQPQINPQPPPPPNDDPIIPKEHSGGEKEESEMEFNNNFKSTIGNIEIQNAFANSINPKLSKNNIDFNANLIPD